MMKSTKKILCAAAMAMALSAAPMTSFGFFFGWKTTSSETKAEEETVYQFKSGETVIAMGGEASPVLTALGTADRVCEQDSCAYQGKDKVYMYKGFDICTYPVNGKECISAVYLMDETVSTPEGIKIGSTLDEALKAYGKDYKEEFGVYRYKAGNTELSIYTTNKIVDSIEYLVVTE